MASGIAYDEVKKWLSDNWGGTYSVVDYEDSNKALSQGSEPFLALEELTSVDQANSLAGVRPGFEERAIFSIHVLFPTTANRSAARTLADQIAKEGRNFDMPDSDGRLWQVDPPYPDKTNDGLWHDMTVEVDYRRWRTETITRPAYVPPAP